MTFHIFEMCMEHYRIETLIIIKLQYSMCVSVKMKNSIIIEIRKNIMAEQQFKI